MKLKFKATLAVAACRAESVVVGLGMLLDLIQKNSKAVK